MIKKEIMKWTEVVKKILHFALLTEISIDGYIPSFIAANIRLGLLS